MDDNTKEYNGNNRYTNKECPTLQLGGSWNLVTLNSRVGERGVREEKNKKIFSWGLSYQGGIPQGEVAPLAIHSNWKCKTSKIFTCHDETVTLTFNLTQLFYFQNISFLFSANKSKHTTSNLKYLKWQKVGRSHLIFVFREEFPYEGNQGNAYTHLHTMNTKHQVLNRFFFFCFTKAKNVEIQK